MKKNNVIKDMATAKQIKWKADNKEHIKTYNRSYYLANKKFKYCKECKLRPPEKHSQFCSECQEIRKQHSHDLACHKYIIKNKGVKHDLYKMWA